MVNFPLRLELDGSIDYLILFLFGKKSDIMKSIEKDYEKKEMVSLGFKRSNAFFHMFNITIHFGRGWLILLPARHGLEYQNSRNDMTLNCSLFALYIQNKMSMFPDDVRDIIDDKEEINYG